MLYEYYILTCNTSLAKVGTGLQHELLFLNSVLI